MLINFTSSKDSDETHNMHTKSNNIVIIVSSETEEITEELFKSLLQKYQERSSYIDSPEWLGNKSNNKSKK